MQIGSPPEIFNFGHRNINEILFDVVQVEEKVDGSQFAFCKSSETLDFHARSRKTQLDPNAAGMFQKAIDAVRDLPLHADWIYRGEFLSKPKHNVLAYDRVPVKNVIIYDIMTGGENYLSPMYRQQEASRLGLEVVPVLYCGTIEKVDHLRPFLETQSILGGQRVEGIVIKNYDRYGTDKKVLMAKLVREDFKETMHKEWKQKSNKDILDTLAETYRTIPRWQKAVQHLREMELLVNEPKDIGALVKEVQQDIEKECGDEIRDALFRWAWPQLSRRVVAGLPQWYKEELIRG